MNLYSVFIIMRFWNLLWWIIGIPFVAFVWLTILYCIVYALWKAFSWLKDFVKYPWYYIDVFIKRWKKNYKLVMATTAIYLALSTIITLIIYWID